MASAHFAAQCVSVSHFVSDTAVARSAAAAEARRVFVAVTRSAAVAVDASVAVAAEWVSDSHYAPQTAAAAAAVVAAVVAASHIAVAEFVVVDTRADRLGSLDSASPE